MVRRFLGEGSTYITGGLSVGNGEKCDREKLGSLETGITVGMCHGNRDTGPGAVLEGHLSPGAFWRPMSFDDLARSQNMQQPTSLDQIVGSWPGEVDDGFEEGTICLRLGQIRKARRG